MFDDRGGDMEQCIIWGSGILLVLQTVRGGGHRYCSRQSLFMGAKPNGERVREQQLSWVWLDKGETAGSKVTTGLEEREQGRSLLGARDGSGLKLRGSHSGMCMCACQQDRHDKASDGCGRGTRGAGRDKEDGQD